MRMGIVGPKNSSTIIKIEKIIEEFYTDVKLNIKYYTHLDEVEDIVKLMKFSVDCVLFTGYLSKIKGEKFLLKKTSRLHIPFGTESIMLSLLKAHLVHKHDFDKICLVTLSRISLKSLNKELGLNDETFETLFPRYINNEMDTDKTYEEIKKSYEKGDISCVITTIRSFHEKLTANNIIAYPVVRSEETVIAAVERLYLMALAELEKSSQVVALSLSIDRTKKYSVEKSNDYYYVIKTIDIYKEVYKFAENIQAAVIEESFGNFIMFSTRNIVEEVTHNFTKLSFLHDIEKTKCGTISMGIGFGRTAIEAKKGADLGMEKARKNGGNSGYVVHNRTKFLPIMNNYELEAKSIDDWITKVSLDSKVGVNTVFKLHRIKEEYHIDEITPKDLADLYGITLRSMNKIITKLEQSNYIENVGYKQIGGVGRPSRIIRLLF